MSKESKIVSLIAIVFIIGFGLLIWKGQDIAGITPSVVDSKYLIRETSHTTGSRTAKVAMVEFGDYQCPACAAVSPYLKEVSDHYVGNPDFTFVFRNFPLPQHANALISAEAAEAAGAQGKYFEMHHLLYEKQNEWAEVANPLPIFEGYAKTIGLNVGKFSSEVNTKAYASMIEADAKDGNAVNINHTPTVFINGLELKTYNPKEIIAIIDALLVK